MVRGGPSCLLLSSQLWKSARGRRLITAKAVNSASMKGRSLGGERGSTIIPAAAERTVHAHLGLHLRGAHMLPRLRDTVIRAHTRGVKIVTNARLRMQDSSALP